MKTINDKTLSSDIDTADIFYSEKLDKYCILFNAKLFTFKTYSGFCKKLSYFVEKYDLK